MPPRAEKPAIPSAQLAEQAAQLAIKRLSRRLRQRSGLSDTQLASLAQSVVRFRQMYAAFDRQADAHGGEQGEDVRPMPKRLNSKTLQVIKEQVYGICE